jgi:hypothetical protein
VSRVVMSIVAALVSLSACVAYDNIRSKGEYAVLQAAEYEQRDKHLVAVEILTRQEYRVAGFRSRDGGTNAWVLLNPRYRPLYKQVPADSRLVISPADLERVRRTPGISAAVLTELEKQAADQGR